MASGTMTLEIALGPQAQELLDVLKEVQEALIAINARLDALEEPEADDADVLTGILAARVKAQDGRCLICNDDPALYCGAHCASRGR